MEKRVFFIQKKSSFCDISFHYIMFEQERRGNTENQTYLDNSRVIHKVIFPLNEILIDFFDALKSVTKGYARYNSVECRWTFSYNNYMKNCEVFVNLLGIMNFCLSKLIFYLLIYL